MAAHSFPNAKEVMATANSIWWGLSPEDWQEAFAMQPPMGARTDLAEATPEVMVEIGQGEQLYEQRFGWPFVATALGKTAATVLRLLEERLQHEPAAELRISAEQQLQIAHNRLKRLLARL